MTVDVTELHAFYASPLGAVAERFIARALLPCFGDLRGLSVLGLGYAVPFLAGLEGRCGRVLAFMPGQQGAMNWPPSGRSATCLVDPLTLPLPDASIDRVLVAHALEAVENPCEFLHEVSRILAPGGRVVLVCPNRRGLWARSDRTPFGDGQPYSRSQLRGLLRKAQFAPERWAETLYVPPFRSRTMLRTALAWERLGRSLALPFAGVHVLEAAKQVHRPVTVRSQRRSRAHRPVLVSAPATRDWPG